MKIQIKIRMLTVLTAMLIGGAAVMTRDASAATLTVDDNGVQCPGAAFTTIQSAVAVASPGDTIKVCAGSYSGDVNIPASLTGLKLKGAKQGSPFSGRTFAGPAESTLTGKITVMAANVTIRGFSLTNPNGSLGILVKTSGSGAEIQHNIIDTVTTSAGNAVGIYLEYGPDNVSITRNVIRNLNSNLSAQGILIGDSTSGDPSLNINIQGNLIENITSTLKGAYGVQVNNGSSTAPTATGYSVVVIKDNIIDHLAGQGWAHAIGLEGDTPGVVVKGNCISDIKDLTPTPFNNAIAVWFEDNPSFGSGKVNNNNFDRVEYGIVVHPALTTAFPSALVDGEKNWWGASNGPGPIGPGSGAKVSPGVDYRPWLRSRGDSCGGDRRGDDGDDNDNRDDDRDDH